LDTRASARVWSRAPRGTSSGPPLRAIPPPPPSQDSVISASEFRRRSQFARDLLAWARTAQSLRARVPNLTNITSVPAGTRSPSLFNARVIDARTRFRLGVPR